MFFRASLLALLVETAGAQMNLLTPREAVQIVGMIPAVAEAQRLGFCPRFSAAYGDALDKLGVQVRYGCGSYAGQLINNYEIDLKTGAAVELESRRSSRNPEGDQLARVLLKGAAARVLSPEEGRCLALVAAKSLPDWGGPGRSVSVEQSGPFGSRFRAHLRAQDPPMVAERFLTVDRTTAHVHDDETGAEVVSAGLAALTSKMLALRLPSLLSEADALEIARQVPEVRAQALKPCSVFSVGGPLSWEDIYIGLQSRCEGEPTVSNILVAVNPRTGAVTDPDNRKQLESSVAARMARERLEQLAREKISIREDLKEACRPR